MTELKTLKDLRFQKISKDDDAILVSKLKAEAVKLVKYLRGRLSKEIWKDDVNYVPWDSVLEMFKQLENFFNLTEEDLR